jgi:hypothetical protein
VSSPAGGLGVLPSVHVREGWEKPGWPSFEEERASGRFEAQVTRLCEQIRDSNGQGYVVLGRAHLCERVAARRLVEPENGLMSHLSIRVCGEVEKQAWRTLLFCVEIGPKVEQPGWPELTEASVEFAIESPDRQGRQ